MTTSTWSKYSGDQITALDTMAPSTTTERIDVSRLFQRLSTTTTRRVDWQRIFRIGPFFIGVESSSTSHRLPVISTTTVSESRIPSLLHQQSRARMLQRFLAVAVQKHEISRDTADLAWKVLQAIRASVNRALPIPDAGIGPDGEVLFLWKQNEHHFELEVLPNGKSELFYINHNTDDMWEYDYDSETSIPEEVARQLTPFVIYDR